MKELQDAIQAAKKAHQRKPKDHGTLAHAINLMERVHGKNAHKSYDQIIADTEKKGQ